MISMTELVAMCFLANACKLPDGTTSASACCSPAFFGSSLEVPSARVKALYS